MALSGKQKKSIKKNIRKKSLERIASELKVSVNEIEKYLKKIWGGKKYKKFISKRGKKTGETNLEKRVLSFSFKTWLVKNRAKLLFLIFLVLLVYINSLGNEFVSDDVRSIIQNKNLDNIGYLFSSIPSFFQPLHLFIINKLFGRIPIYFRFVNIFFHLGAVLVTYLLIYLLVNSQAAFFAASIFAVHPIEIESVAWISGGPYTKYSFFLVLSFLFFILIPKKKQYLWYSQVFFIFALFSSEKAMVLPLILLFFMLAFGKIKKDWKNLIIPFAIAFIWLLIYINRIPGRLEELQVPRTLAQTTKLSNLLLQFPIAISSYLELLFWPKNLTLYHSELSFSFVEYLIRATVLVSFLAIIFLSLKKNRHVSFWLSFFFISLLPNLTPFGISWLVAERYLYLGSIGIFVVVGLTLKNLMDKQKLKPVIIALFSLIIIGLSARTILRNIDWKNQDNLWLAAAKTSPSSPQNHNNLGDMYSRHGNFEKAVEEFKKAIELRPGYADAYHNLANTYQQMGKTEEAMENYKKAIEFNPALWQSYQNLAVFYFNQEKLDLALETLKKAVEVNPQESSLYTSLGIVYKKMGELEKAKESFQKALVLDPQSSKAKQLLLTTP